VVFCLQCVRYANLYAISLGLGQGLRKEAWLRDKNRVRVNARFGFGLAVRDCWDCNFAIFRYACRGRVHSVRFIFFKHVRLSEVVRGECPVSRGRMPQTRVAVN